MPLCETSKWNLGTVSGRCTSLVDRQTSQICICPTATDATLRAFVKSPGDVVPGTKMRFWGLGNERQIDDLLAYLRTFQ